jgi:hypothetical protein
MKNLLLKERGWWPPRRAVEPGQQQTRWYALAPAGGGGPAPGAGSRPLADDLPALLPPGGMAPPAIRLLLLILAGQRIFTRAAMQGERPPSAAVKAPGGHGQAEFVDALGTGATHPAGLLSGWRGGDDDPAGQPCRAHRHSRAVIEGANHAALRVGDLLIGGQVQAGLDFIPFEEVVVLAPHHRGQISQVGEHRPRARVPIQAEDGARGGTWWAAR